MRRTEAVARLAGVVSAEDLFVCALGRLWDDWWDEAPEARDRTFFPSVMGSVCSIALGLALALPGRRAVALEADGSLLMGVSILTTLGREQPPNLTVVVFDNEMYEGTGGQPTHTAAGADLAAMAIAAGCPDAVTVDTADALAAECVPRLREPGLGVVVAKLAPGGRERAPEGRRTTTGVEDKLRFLRELERSADRTPSS